MNKGRKVGGEQADLNVRNWVCTQIRYRLGSSTIVSPLILHGRLSQTFIQSG